MAGMKESKTKKIAEKKKKKATVKDLPGTGLVKKAGISLINRHKMLKSI